jgi:uncharacterized peroxidase-related enzyme
MANLPKGSAARRDAVREATLGTVPVWFEGGGEMTFIRVIEDDQASGRARELFDADLAKDGYVWNLTRVLAIRPQVLDAWRSLVGAIRTTLDLRRYELVTFAAARALRASYCMLAHGSILRDKFVDADQVAAMARDPATAGLSPAEVGMMEFAAKVATEADRMTQADVDRLRGFGFSDPEVLDVTLAAAARAFFTKVLDGLGAQPDASYQALPPELRSALIVGRPIAEGALGVAIAPEPRGS